MRPDDPTIVLADEDASVVAAHPAVFAGDGGVPHSAAVGVAFAGADEVTDALSDARRQARVIAGHGAAEPILAGGPLGARLNRPPLTASVDQPTSARAAVDAFPAIGETLTLAPALVEIAGGVRWAVFNGAPLMAAGLHLHAASNPLAIALRLVGEALVHARRWSVTAVVSAHVAIRTGDRARPSWAAGGVQLTPADERSEAALISGLACGHARVGVWRRRRPGRAPPHADPGTVTTVDAVGVLQTDVVGVAVGVRRAIEVVEAQQLAAITHPNLTVGAIARRAFTAGSTTARRAAGVGARVSHYGVQDRDRRGVVSGEGVPNAAFTHGVVGGRRPAVIARKRRSAHPQNHTHHPKPCSLRHVPPSRPWVLLRVRLRRVRVQCGAAARDREGSPRRTTSRFAPRQMARGWAGSAPARAPRSWPWGGWSRLLGGRLDYSKAPTAQDESHPSGNTPSA